MIDWELVARIGVGVALAAALLWETRGYLPKIPLPSMRRAPNSYDVGKDMHTLLDIAERLKQNGKPQAVTLCKQLVDVMLDIRNDPVLRKL